MVENPSNRFILHISTRQAWEAAQKAGEYAPDSLENEGFIHCSRQEQIPAVANLFYHDVPDLVVLWIEIQKVHNEIRWERVGEKEFPHIYGSLNLDAVCAVNDYLPDIDGLFHQQPALSC